MTLTRRIKRTCTSLNVDEKDSFILELSRVKEPLLTTNAMDCESYMYAFLHWTVENGEHMFVDNGDLQEKISSIKNELEKVKQSLLGDAMCKNPNPNPNPNPEEELSDGIEETVELMSRFEWISHDEFDTWGEAFTEKIKDAFGHFPKLFCERVVDRCLALSF
jgi:hypothetical protein